MRHIRRWGLMRNTEPENNLEHSMQCAYVAHALALIANRFFDDDVNAQAVLAAAAFHDVSEVITGDLATPIKHHNPRIHEAFRAMESLARYDSELVVGILGGSAGTTLDAFQMLADAKKYGARVALYGRKINNAEHQLSFVTYLRAIADGRIAPVEAVKAYHGDLEKLGVKPRRTLEQDLERMEMSDGYGGTSTSKGQGGKKSRSDSKPDFSKMTAAEKLQWNLARLRKW